MEAAVEKMAAQLKRWSLKIESLAAHTQEADARARFEDLIYIDELKVLHAIAQSKLDEFTAAGAPERERLKADMKDAWNELGAALKRPKPKGSAMRVRARGGSLIPSDLQSIRARDLGQG